MAEEWAGVVYILTNPSFEDLVKIGFAKDLEERVRNLSSSPAIPYGFHAYAFYYVEHKLDDKIIHNLIDALNPDLRTIETYKGRKREREFYAMTPEEAYAILEGIAKISGTTDRLHKVKPDRSEEEDRKSIEEDHKEVSARRSPFSFTKCGIHEGEKINFKEDPSYVATVVDDKHVLYDGVTYSTSGLTRELMKTIMNIDVPAWQGPIHWTYNGKLLNDIRTEREAKGTYK